MLGDGLFPRLSVAGHFEIGYHEGRDACLGASTDTSGTFVADFTTDTGCGAWKWGDRGRVIVGLYFAKNVELAGCFTIRLGWTHLIDFPPVGEGAWDHAAVVRVGGECAL